MDELHLKIALEMILNGKGNGKKPNNFIKPRKIIYDSCI